MKKEKILVLSASPNKNGNSALLSTWFTDPIDTKKYAITTVYLYDYTIPYLKNENFNAPAINDAHDQSFIELMELIENHTQIIITTPIWNFGIPSSLKNVIDRALYSGRQWSEEKKKTVPSWGDKKFYLLFTMGAKWYQSIFNYMGVVQLYLTLWYYGAKRRVIGVAYNCGNGKRCVIENRTALKRKLTRRAKRYFN